MPAHPIFNLLDGTNGLFTCETQEVVRRPTGCGDNFLDIIPIIGPDMLHTQYGTESFFHYYPTPVLPDQSGNYIPAPPTEACAWPEPCGSWGAESFGESHLPCINFECSVGPQDVFRPPLYERWIHQGRITVQEGDRLLNQVRTSGGRVPPDVLLRLVSDALVAMSQQFKAHARWGDRTTRGGVLDGVYRILQTAPVGTVRTYDSETDTVTVIPNMSMPSLAADVLDARTLMGIDPLDPENVNTASGDVCVYACDSNCADGSGPDIFDKLYSIIRKKQGMAMGLTFGDTVIQVTNAAMPIRYVLHVSSRSAIQHLKEQSALRISRYMNLGNLRPSDLTVNMDFARIEQRLAALNASSVTSVDGIDYGYVYIGRPGSEMLVPIYYDPWLRNPDRGHLGQNVQTEYDSDGDGTYDCCVIQYDMALIPWSFNGQPTFGWVYEPVGPAFDRMNQYFGGLFPTAGTGMANAPRNLIDPAFMAGNEQKVWKGDESGMWQWGIRIIDATCLDIALRTCVQIRANMRWAAVFVENLCAPCLEDEWNCDGAWGLPSVVAVPAGD